VLVLGGAKMSDKLEVVGNLLGLVDTVLVGGVMAFPFLAALGHPIGASPATREEVETARGQLLRAAAIGTDIVLPSDLVVAQGASNDAPHRTVSRSVPPGLLGLDIGPETVKLFESVLDGARTVFWNGPMGVFEVEAFASGTREIARILTASDAYTVVGGGDTGAAIRALGFTDDQFGHVSTGGGASLQYLQGRSLPGLEALDRD
jgi:phosphoglycerate kinase